MYDLAKEDEMWTQVRKMVYGNSLVLYYRYACDQAEIPRSEIAQECEEFVQGRRRITAQFRKNGESMRSLVKAMTANQLYGIEDRELGNSRAATALKTWDNNL